MHKFYGSIIRSIDNNKSCALKKSKPFPISSFEINAKILGINKI